MPAAFYAPLKSPDHPSPSGDRAMARLLVDALRRAGFSPGLASGLRTFEPAGDPRRQEQLRETSRAEAARLVAGWRAGPPGARPRLWFTYHCYYKAPDWIGPAVTRELGIPYVVAEGSRAGKRAGGPWRIGHAGAEAALDAAHLLLSLTGQDREALARHRSAGQVLVDLPPFLDPSGWPEVAATRGGGGAPRLLAVAMMRDGDKLASYRQLAAALAAEAGADWTLDIVGDGPARPETERAFAALGPRVTFHGRVDDRGRLAAIYGASDLLVWPAVNEAYGMALLEAQALGCPVLAGRHGGVATVLRDGETGLLVPPDDPAALARALRGLLADPARLRRMSGAASAFVRTERHLAGAAAILRAALGPLVAETAAA